VFSSLRLKLEPGHPIGIPRALTSAERATTQPSLFERTTTGRVLSLGSNSFSQLA
jgi:hypothetical protein